ncbi:RNB-domain-containing protein [Martensiomyces pterosporus]|nr:RNB-domain-containing protein [Martensiomyces pterosporus]
MPSTTAPSGSTKKKPPPPSAKADSKKSNTTSDSAARPSTPQLLPKIYESYYDAAKVEHQMAAGILVRGVLRVNPKQRTDAYVSLDDGNDIYICGDICRNRAITGDIVVVKILSKKQADEIYRANRLRDDKRKDRDRAARKKRLESMASAMDADPSSPASSQSGRVSDKNDADAGYQVPEVFGAVVSVLSRNEARRFTGSLSTQPPKSLARYPRFVDSLGQDVVWFKPLSDATPYMVLSKRGIPSALYARSSRHYCTVLMRTWSPREPLPWAEYVKDLGQRGPIDIETAIILEENDVATDPFSPDVIKCLPKTPWRIPEKELNGRTDLRADCIFTIDPPTARDLDDAVSCKSLPNGNVLVGVHIADVSYFVRPKTALDREARQRATTTYMVQRAYSMLPSILCEELCSLNPGVDRLAFSVMWEMDPKSATVLSTWFGRTIISSACKLAYDDAQHVIDGNCLPDSIPLFEYQKGRAVPASPRRKAQIESSIVWFYKLSKIMRKRRFDSGALSLNSVKLTFDLDDSGAPIDCRPYIIKDSNRLIEEFMLLANMSVAARMERTFPDASLLRRHSPPLQRRLDNICEQLRHSGIDINPGSASDIQVSLNKISDPDTRATVENILTGPMQRAAYFSTHAIDDKAGYKHYALNVPLYTHFTSPIRRYADVIVHRTLEASLAAFGNFVSGDHPLLPKYSKAIAEIAHQCNLRKDAAKKAQEASSNLFLVSYLISNAKQIATPGVVSVGVITKIKDDGFVVMVPMFGIDGTIYMDRMADKRNQVATTDGRKWTLKMWSVQTASVSLVWDASPQPPNQERRKDNESLADALGEELSALVIDDDGRSIAHFERSEKAESVTQTLKIFDKVTVCVLPTLTPPDLSIKLAMPTIYQ